MRNGKSIGHTSNYLKVELDGGYLENMIEIEKDEKISEFVVKNYSCNIWTEYTTSLFIYKTSLMKAEDKFTSFLKIGFSLDVKSNKFVVLQNL